MVKQSLSFLKFQTRFDLESLKRSNLFLFILAFALLLVFSIHNFDSIGQDIGRHLKIGEIIWQTGEVPKTNLFSFTEPDFPFINHHWLSEVIFFGVFNLGGFTGLILLKAVLIFAAFLLLFLAVKIPLEAARARSAPLLLTGWPLLISFLFSMFIFIERTEVRPEMFSFVILAFFLFVLFKAKYENVRNDGSVGSVGNVGDENSIPTSKAIQQAKRSNNSNNPLWFLPLAQLFWVNLHIYFFIGPFLILAFFLDRLVVPRSDLESSKRSDLIRIALIGALTSLATLVNPAGVQGALLPFNILNEYGYRIVENQTLSFLADFISFNLSIFVFKLSAGLLVLSWILTAKKIRSRLFEFIISAFFIYAGFKMLRNLPLYALASFPIMAILLTDVQHKLARFSITGKAWLTRPCLSIVAGFLVFMIFFVVNNSFYKHTNSPKIFGFSVPNGLENAVNFVKENNIEGPMFNNFNIGGYLIWRLPEEKVFVDNRPEAYSIKFFNEIYKPMQENQEKWAEFSEKYGINFIFFDPADITPWGNSFLKNIVKNPDWKVVYINEDAIILVKDNNRNAGIISKFSVTDKNGVIVDKIVGYIKDSNKNKVDLNLILSRILYKMDWRAPSVYFVEEAIKLDPKNPQAYWYKGLTHAYYTDKQNQEIAAENIKKAIDLGLKESRNYTILGVVYLNLGRLESARESLNEAVRLDKNNTQAREFLEKYFSNF